MAVFRLDPCGIICILITYSALLYADYVVVVHMVIPSMSDTLWGAFHAVIFNLFLFLLTVSHVRAVFSDPGIVPLPEAHLDFSDMHSGNNKKKLLEKKEGQPAGWTVCLKCETYRPPRAHHCRICQRCIKRMDHHCPWINNCVGEYNQKFFIQFLVYVGISSCYALSLTVGSWIIDPQGTSPRTRHTRVLHTVLLVVECVLFGIFVMAIGCDQISAILSDETLVEQVKKEGPRRHRPKMALLAEVFGKGHPLLWLCPFQPLSGVSSTDANKQFIV
ncbi:palmitoyltransferase ZDHHC3 [Lingula anatina]|uniref:Palmitoyltransferase n=1 Tax=Lingula anatina TaxID=7574 RepID=A0A1S3J444_LINAN|nr:palmitoyltransferase ZDHHC3 [Lingula anatina]|eukprot:XP_013404609.1 palmitoyltransferase ZDHHC3 [Lingula anatina]